MQRAQDEFRTIAIFVHSRISGNRWTIDEHNGNVLQYGGETALPGQEHIQMEGGGA